MQQTTGTSAVPTRETAPTAAPVVGERPAVLDLPVPTGAAPAGTPIFDALLAQRRTTFALATRADRGPATQRSTPATGGLPTQQTGPTQGAPTSAAVTGATTDAPTGAPSGTSAKATAAR